MAGPREAWSVESQGAEWHWSPDQTITAKLQVQARPSDSEGRSMSRNGGPCGDCFPGVQSSSRPRVEHVVLDSDSRRSA